MIQLVDSNIHGQLNGMHKYSHMEVVEMAWHFSLLVCLFVALQSILANNTGFCQLATSSARPIVTYGIPITRRPPMARPYKDMTAV